jgi:hypothetical protein
MENLIEEIKLWEDHVENEISRITSDFVNKFRPLIQGKLQSLADELGFEIVIDAGMGTASADVNDYKNNLQYDVDVFSRYEVGANINAINVSIERLDNDKDWDDPRDDDDVYDSLVEEMQEKLLLVGHVVQLMIDAQQTDGMCCMEFSVKPKV